ncbi:putative metal-binding motif-containing protein [Desulfobacula phenolica]|uniref:Transglutaminase-like superfamily protein n=1 Tax=Desulfobacula phenolica TaxID=90732 RepID=A0A1H2IZR3_9BACT|nr:putative metal-binding motif-containing protein [Desulfobacula phenolica]SDU49415.1 Transglutaminase-like superfamily protein [Desulfobacula phenolica]
MKIVKRTLGVIIIFTSLFCNFSYAFAEEGYHYHINPAYIHLAKQRSSISSKNTIKLAVAIQCYSYDDLKNALSVQLKNHTQNFQIHMEYDFQFSEVGDILMQVQNEVFSDDDYLANSYVSYSYSWSGYNGNVDIDLQIDFLTTYEEEQAITQRVQEILYGENGIIDLEMNAEEKEKEIHDWIVLNVEYDTSLVEHSAYAALFHGKTVCQGYSLLMYRMLDIVDIESRIVVSDSMNHAWNMVYLCGNWYHLDVTWDDPIPDTPGRVLYNYYNLSDSEINDDHILTVGYPTASLAYIEGVCGSDPPSLNIYYRDYDNDGYGDPDSPYETSSQPSGYVKDNTDCNDYDSSIHPGATEIRGDGIDQDCDGSDYLEFATFYLQSKILEIPSVTIDDRNMQWIMRATERNVFRLIKQIPVTETVSESAIFNLQTHILEIPSVTIGDRDMKWIMRATERNMFQLIRQIPVTSF